MLTNSKKLGPIEENDFIEKNLTPMQKLMVYLIFTGVLFLRAVGFNYQEAKYSNPDHPRHVYYNEVQMNKFANLAAAVFVFMWYVYNMFIIDPLYHKYAVRRSEIQGLSEESRRCDTSEPVEEKISVYISDPDALMEVKSINPRKFIAIPITELGVLPWKMTLSEFDEWRELKLASILDECSG